MNLEIIKYNRNFIRKVIFRIDFLDFIRSEDIFTSDLVSAIKKSYPNKGIDQVMRFNIINLNSEDNIAGSNFQKQALEGLQQTFLTSDSGGKLVLTNKSLIIEIDNYQTFSEFVQSFKNIITVLFRMKQITTERIGIRFINIFDNDLLTIRKNFFSDSIASTIDIPVVRNTEQLAPIRSITLVEYRTDNLVLNFRFGRINLQYPRAIKSTDFTLDFDCYTSEGLQTVDEIITFLNTGHTYIQELFESSITDKLRREMQ